jgi:alkanesulfonate monooxygenase SsuD/methylene tetrahydromethanopterin reductase-like flavin-dependent oxidoreductase (luciferase family)
VDREVSDDRLRFGIRLPTSGPFGSATNVLRIAARAAELRYDSIWTNDHISWTHEMLTHFGAGSIEAVREGQDPNFYESVTTLAVLAGRHEGIDVGIAGLVLPLRDPRLLAKQIATFGDLIGPERLIVAVAIGNIPNDFEVVGVPWQRRGKITTDHLAALRAILDGPQPVTFESKTLSFSGGVFFPRPRGIRIWVTGGVDAPLERIARYGDGWLTGNATPDEYRGMLARIRSTAAEIGRELVDFTPAYELFVCVGSTRDEAIEIATKSLLRRYPSVERGLDACAVGTADDVIGRLRRFAEAGVRSFELKLICRTIEQMESMMAMLADRTQTVLAG